VGSGFTFLSFFHGERRIGCIMVTRRIFQDILNAMDRLAAAIAAGLYNLAMMWLEGVAAYGLALHGHAPDLNMHGKGRSADDEKRQAQEWDGDLNRNVDRGQRLFPRPYLVTQRSPLQYCDGSPSTAGETEKPVTKPMERTVP
jgi:hypothetical protein